MNICILGSTGSIGTQTLDIVRENPEIRVVGLSANGNVELLYKQALEFSPLVVCLVDEKKAAELKLMLGNTGIKVVGGKDGLIEIATLASADTVVSAVVGISGLAPTLAAIKAKKDIALANKETLVTGGHLVMKAAKENGVKILPVDSEHSAIFQSMQGMASHDQIKKIILTASGGPFFGRTRDELLGVTPADALKHPNWDMGAKVTIDSATLVNKGLEVIEAKWLFNVDVDRIQVVVHRQSVVHSMVEYVDNGIIAQLGVPDMHLPIQYALTFPNRVKMQNNELSFEKYSTLTFSSPDTKTFKALDIAYMVAREGGILPTVFNSADEAAVEMFLCGKLSFLQISDAIEHAVSTVKNIKNPSIEDIYSADKLSRQMVYDYKR